MVTPTQTKPATLLPCYPSTVCMRLPPKPHVAACPQRHRSKRQVSFSQVLPSLDSGLLQQVRCVMHGAVCAFIWGLLSLPCCYLSSNQTQELAPIWTLA